MAVYIDTEDPTSSPALKCESVKAERWNGFVGPGHHRSRFSGVHRCVASDGPQRHVEPYRCHGGAEHRSLVYRDGDDNEDWWELYGVTESGDGLYALDGWTWIEA